jgi:hypothetical protein
MADTPRVAAPLQHGKMESLSGSTDDRGIKVVPTSTPGTIIHKNSSGSTQLVYLWLTNTDGSTRVTTLEVGGVTAPDDLFAYSLVATSSVEAAMGIPLGPGKTIGAFAAQANTQVIRGYAITIG